MSTHEQIVECLSRLGVATLTRFLGNERVERLNELGIGIGVNTLAEFMAITNGMDGFRDRKLRLDLLSSMGSDRLQKLFDTRPDNLPDAIIDFNRFNWGYNPKSRRFLEVMEISTDQLDTPPADNLSSSLSDDELKIEHPLHPYQNWIRKEVVAELMADSSHRFMLHMPTGSGKTRTTMESLIDYVRIQENAEIVLVWFAHSEELCGQAVESIKNSWNIHGSETAQVLRLWGGKNIPEIAEDRPVFAVTSFQTAYRMLHTQDDDRFAQFARIRAKCKVLVVDEAHQSTAPTYKEAIELFANSQTKVIGLTATPGRHHVGQDEGETSDLADFYSNRKITIVGNSGESLENPIQFLTKEGILSHVDRYTLNSNQNFELTDAEVRHMEDQLEIPNSVLKRIGMNAARTNLVATHTMRQVFNESACVIVFAPSKDNADELASLLTYQGISARSVTSDSFRSARREAIEQFRSGEVSVLVNFGVLTTGFDAPNVDVVIVARPTTSVVLYSQMIGRGLRGVAMGGTERCKIIDVKDNILRLPSAEEAFTYFDAYY